MRRFHTVLAKITLAAAALAIFTLTGCNDEDDVYEYIKLSTSSYTFNKKNAGELKIDVRSAPGWTAEIDGDWIVEVSKNDNSYTITAEDNDSGKDRTGKITFRAGGATEVLSVSQVYTATNAVFRLLNFENLQGAGISLSGKTIAVITFRIEGSDYFYTPHLIDVPTGEVRTFDETDYKITDVRGVSDVGIVSFYSGSDDRSYLFDNGNFSTPPNPFSTRWCDVQMITPDGRTWAGFWDGGWDEPCVPLKWVDGVPTVLPVPEKNSAGRVAEMGWIARGMSADGSKIYGAERQNYDFLYWKDDKFHTPGWELTDYEVQTINDDWGGSWERHIMNHLQVNDDNHYAMSEDGTYVALRWKEEDRDNTWSIASYYPAMINLDTYETYVNREEGMGRHVGVSALNNGILLTNLYETDFGGFLDTATGNYESMQEYIATRYGLTTNRVITPMYSTGDGKTVFGDFIASALNLNIRKFWYVTYED